MKTTTLYGYEKCKPQPFRVARVKLTKNKNSQTFLVIHFDTASVQTQTVYSVEATRGRAVQTVSAANILSDSTRTSRRYWHN